MVEDHDEIPERFQDEDVQLGSRTDALIDEDQTSREWVRVENDDREDDLYWFDIKEISWEKKTDILDQSLQTDNRTGDVELELKDFYRNMMEEVIVDLSVEGSVPVFLKGMRPEVGDQLQDLVPQPGTVMDEMDEGN